MRSHANAPSERYPTPEAILDHPALTRGQKVRLLRSWAFDVGELLVAEDEGMPAGEPGDLGRVLRALGELTGCLDEEVTPTSTRGAP